MSLHWNSGLCGLSGSPVVSPDLSAHECGTARSTSCRLTRVANYRLAIQLQPCPPRSTIRCLNGSISHRLATSPLCPAAGLPPLLPVWMNVSSLTSWLLDFHTVQFSVSSGCFLFLNCCCPSFGCARRHSVSTYASILAGSTQR